MNEQSLRIINLDVENVKRLKAIRIKPDRTLVRIEGRNAQGKSSVLDAIAAAVGGGAWNPELPVRKGEKRASAKLDLNEELSIERRWTAAGGTTLEVTSKGIPQKSPQAILDKLFSDLSFDPLGFVRMKPKEQAELLKRLAGLNFDDLDNDRARLYAERTVANRNKTNAEASLGPIPPSMPTGPVDVADLAKKNTEAVVNNAAMDRIAAEIGGCESTIAGIERQWRGENEHIESLTAKARAEIAELEQRQKTANGARASETATAKAKTESLKAALAGMNRIDVAGFATEIAKAETANRMIRELESYKARLSDLVAKKKQADAFDDAISAIDDEKSRRLVAAKFPLAGLSVDANGPTLNGIPFSQASSAEQLKTSVAIGLSENRKAKIILIRDGSLLDGDGLKALSDIAAEYDAQIFVERVSDERSPSAVIIEDGEVVSEPAEVLA